MSRRTPSAAVVLDFETQSLDGGEGPAPAGGSAEHDVERQSFSDQRDTDCRILDDEETGTVDDESPLAGAHSSADEGTDVQSADADVHEILFGKLLRESGAQACAVPPGTLSLQNYVTTFLKQRLSRE